MSTQASTRYLLRRVAARAGLGVWGPRGGVLLSALIIVALGGYAAPMTAGLVPSSLSTGGASLGGGAADCADTAIAALADRSTAATQAAYRCMAPSFRQRVSEQTFAQQMESQNLPNVKKLTRVGDYTTPTGGTMVYYAVDANTQSVGYIVYLGQDGKVLRIE